MIVGHSLGEYSALAIAALDPEFCKKMVLLHSSVFAGSDEKRTNRDKVIDFVTKNGLELYVQTFVPSLFYNKSHPQIERVKSISIKTPLLTLVEYTKAIHNRFSRVNLKKTSAPTLILAGDKAELYR